MNIPTVVFTRPRDWNQGHYFSNLLNLVYVPISGDVPKKRSGRLAGDGIGDVLTTLGVRTLLMQIDELKPEIFFHSIHAKITHPLLKKIREKSPKTKIVVMDGNFPNDVSKYVKEHRKFVDAVLLNHDDPAVLQAYKKAEFASNQIGLLWDGFVLEEHPTPVHYTKTIYDCFFAGSNLHNNKQVHFYPGGKFRQSFILQVKDRFRLALYGYQKEWPIPVIGHATHIEYYKTFHVAKITLGANHLDLHRYYTRRTIHSGASGRMFITKYIPGMEEDFENHKHLVWFKNITEGLNLIDSYLQNDKARETVAAQGRKLFLERHSWEARLREFERFVYALL